MSLDNVQALEIEDSVKRDERLSTNSIRFKQESLANAIAKARELEVAKKEVIEKAEEEVAVIEEPIEAVQEEAKDYSLVTANLEKDVNILKSEQGPVELVDTRAIRLMDKMITAAKDNSKGIYAELDKANDNENFTSAEVTPISMDVEAISMENEEPVKDSIDAAIEEESLKNIEAIEEDEVVAEARELIDRDELERKINEKIQNYLDSEKTMEVVPNVEAKEIEVVPNEELAEVAKEEEPEFSFKDIFSEINEPMIIDTTDEAIRDEVIVAPERDEKVEEKIEEYTVVEPKSMVFTSEEKEKLKSYSFEELAEMITDKGKVTEELEQKANSVAADIEVVKNKNNEIVEEQGAAEKKRAELEAEADKRAQELKDMMAEKVVAIENKNNTLTSAIQSREEELASISKDTEERLETIASINKDAAGYQEEISKYEEMKKIIFGESEETNEKVVEKTM